MRRFSLVALLLGILLVPFAVAVGVADRRARVDALDRQLSTAAQARAADLDGYFQRSRSAILLTANQPAFARFDAAPGTRREKLRRGGSDVGDIVQALAYLEQLYPDAIGEACFIDRTGAEAARVVHGTVARAADLSTEEESTVFFTPTFALPAGSVHQTRPYVSPDTREWVVANATVVPSPDGRRHSIVHFEVTVESFRRAFAAGALDDDLYVVDRATGRVVIDARRPQGPAVALGSPRDHRFQLLAEHAGDKGVVTVDGRKAAFRRISLADGNVNDWMVVARSGSPAPGMLDDLGAVPLIAGLLALFLMAIGGYGLRAMHRDLSEAAGTDSLTGLANRRRLIVDLERRLGRAGAAPAALLLFDLDGFKTYNDSFGHMAGDSLLARLGTALRTAVEPGGTAYRLGGDEFCVLCDAEALPVIEVAAEMALTERGEGFAIGASHGAVALPQEATDPAEALRIADERMYARKQRGRTSAGRQTRDVLLRVLAERHPALHEHQAGVTTLAEAVAARLGLPDEDREDIRHAAQLHDVGKIAIPDAILGKPGGLDPDEWDFVRRHTAIGERILSAAPALVTVARLVRASHERWDGTGYPDKLAADAIPLGARIIAVCDAFDAMTTDRPYSRARPEAEALVELRRCAGSQFDPEIVEAFAMVLGELRARIAA
jgi:diguanylate cyclase (GGDEF)-like protein